MQHPLTGRDTVLFAPTGITDGAVSTANLDTRLGDWATIRISFAAEETTHATASTISLLESDDTVVTNFATIVADNSSLDLASAREERYEVDLRGRKRYLRLSITAGTTTGGNITFASIATLHRLGAGPASTTDMGDDGVTIV